ncbi:hypothetical protein ACSSS7_002552 [Eimeria intestinalis]
MFAAIFEADNNYCCRGEVVGVDAMCWMHRGAAACAVELVEGRETDKFLRFFITMVSLLRYYDVTPLIVFDGSRIDVKSGEDEKRRLRRETAKREALELLERKRNNLPVDYKVDKVIAACRELGIRCLVAPFEADAQLAYLSRTNQIVSSAEAVKGAHQHTCVRVGVSKAARPSRLLLLRKMPLFRFVLFAHSAQHSAISEDSDLLAYGCKRVLLKMDKDGKCDVIRLPFLQDENDRPELASREPRTTKQQGMGIATACRLVSQLRSLKRVLDFLCRDKKWSSRFPMTKEEVVEGHLLAQKTFMEHKVFDPRTKRVVRIRALDTQEEAEATGPASEHACTRAIQIASGLIDPRTGEMRQTQLSPAECELIKECQERAFSGLEAQQLKAQAAAYKAEALRKQAEERSLKEAASHKRGGKALERKEEKQNPVPNATTVIRIEKSSEKSETEHEVRHIACVGLKEEVIAGFNAFSASVASACTSNNLSSATEAATDSMHLARQLLSEMTPQGFQLPSTAITTTDDQPESTRTLEPPGCWETAASQSQDTLTTLAETECASRGQGSSSALEARNLEHFAFKWSKTEGGSQPMRTRRRDVVTRTRFAHRTKLVSAAGERRPPFPSLKSAAESTESVRCVSVTPETTKGAGALPPSLESQAKRKSVGFLCGNDKGSASAFLSIRFAREQPKKHKPF